MSVPNLVYLGPTAGDAARVADFLERRRAELGGYGIDLRASGATERPLRRGGRGYVLSDRLAAPGPDLLDLVAGRGTRLVLGLQPLQARLSAAWADEVAAGLTTPFADWLADALAEPEPYAWLLHPERAVRAWVEAAGARRVRLLVVGSPRRTVRLLRKALGVPASALRPGGLGRDLAAAETELLRCVNVAASAGQWPEAVRGRYVAAAGRAVRRSGRSRPATVPRAAYAELARMAVCSAETIRALQVRTLGDPALLGEPPTIGDGPVMLTTEAAARAVAATIDAAGTTDTTQDRRSALVREARPTDLLMELRRRTRLTRPEA